MDMFSLTVEDYNITANEIKEIVLERLQRDNIISKEQALKYNNNWQVIFIKKKWFRRWADKFWADKKEGYVLKYVQFED